MNTPAEIVPEQEKAQTPSNVVVHPAAAQPQLDMAPFRSAHGPMSESEQKAMMQRFLQHFESVSFETGIRPDAGEWVKTPTHEHRLRFNVCERVAAKMNTRERDVWLGSQIDRGRALLQSLGLEMTGKPTVIQDELNPDKCSLEYKVDMADKNGPTHAHDSLPRIAEALKGAAKHYYDARKNALGEQNEVFLG